MSERDSDYLANQAREDYIRDKEIKEAIQKRDSEFHRLINEFLSKEDEQTKESYAVANTLRSLKERIQMQSQTTQNLEMKK